MTTYCKIWYDDSVFGSESYFTGTTVYYDIRRYNIRTWLVGSWIRDSTTYCGEKIIPSFVVRTIFSATRVWGISIMFNSSTLQLCNSATLQRFLLCPPQNQPKQHLSYVIITTKEKNMSSMMFLIVVAVMMMANVEAFSSSMGRRAIQVSKNRESFSVLNAQAEKAQSPFQRKNLPILGAAIGLTALTFQLFILAPYHEVLTKQFETLEVRQLESLLFVHREHSKLTHHFLSYRGLQCHFSLLQRAKLLRIRS